MMLFVVINHKDLFPVLRNVDFFLQPITMRSTECSWDTSQFARPYEIHALGRSWNMSGKKQVLFASLIFHKDDESHNSYNGIVVVSHTWFSTVIRAWSVHGSHWGSLICLRNWWLETSSDQERWKTGVVWTDVEEFDGGASRRLARKAFWKQNGKFYHRKLGFQGWRYAPALWRKIWQHHVSCVWKVLSFVVWVQVYALPAVAASCPQHILSFTETLKVRIQNISVLP